MCPFCEFRFFEPWSFDGWFESLRPVDVTTLKDDICLICHDQYGHGLNQDDCADPLLLPCGHHFGASCLKEWLSPSPGGNGNSCPKCRCVLFEAWPTNNTSNEGDNDERNEALFVEEDLTARFDALDARFDEVGARFDEVGRRLSNWRAGFDDILAAENEEQLSDLRELQIDQQAPTVSSEAGSEDDVETESDSDEEWDPTVLENREAWLERQQYTEGPEDNLHMLMWLQLHNEPITDREIHEHWFEEHEFIHRANHVQRGSDWMVELLKRELEYEISRDESAGSAVATYRQLRLDEQAFRQAQSKRLGEIMKDRNQASLEAYARDIQAWIALERDWTAKLTERLDLLQ